MIRIRNDGTFLPLQGGGQEGDGDLPEQYNYLNDGFISNCLTFLKRNKKIGKFGVTYA